MNREHIVESFFKKDHILTKEALDFLEDRDVEEFLNREYKNTVLMEADFIAGIRVLKNLIHKPKETTTEDFLQFYTSKYEKLRKIIMERLPKDYVSLNKLDSSRNEVYVIGIVKDIKDTDKKIIELEDPTTTMSVIFDKNEKNIEDIELDDVIAVKATAAGKVIYGKQILFPDTPLRQPVRGVGKACFISDIAVDESPMQTEAVFKWLETEDIANVFVLGKIGDIEKFESLVDEYCTNKNVVVSVVGKEFPSLAEAFQSRRIISLSNPAMIEVGGIKVMLSSRMDMQKIKKRHIGKSDIVLAEDYLVIEDVPDIVHHSSNEPTIQNYKSITLVSAGSPSARFAPVLVDLATREASFVEKFK
mgnify:CR=1 FL=1